MDFNFSDEQKLLRDEIVKFAQQELNDEVVQRDREQKFPREQWLKCGELKLQGLPVPEEYGGAGLDPLTTAIALDALGYGCHDGGLAFSICAHLLACVIPIWKFGSEEQKQKYLPKLCSGELIAVNAMSEPDAGSDAFAMRTRAVPDGEGFRLNGVKTFSSNGPVADLAVTFALTDPDKGYYGGVTTFLVEKGADGFKSTKKFEKLGLRTSPIGELVYDNVFVPASQVIGKVGAGATHFTHSMDWERACLVACHVGATQRLLEQAVEYARTRKQFGQTIGKYQAVSHRVADMKIKLEAARLLTYKAASELDRSRQVTMSAAIAKTFGSETLVQTALDTVRIFGGYGFMTEYEVERALRDSIASTIYSGTNEMQRNIIARWLGL